MIVEVVELQDGASGARARVLVSPGMNCFSFEPMVDGRHQEVLWALPDFELGQQRASRSGIPILFPFPGRMSGQMLDYLGNHYDLSGYDDGFGNAIHGYVLSRAWRVITRTPNTVTGLFNSRDVDAALGQKWPADFELTVSYRLSATTLEVEVEIHNPSEHPLPWGLGLHPYFKLPLGPGSHADDCVFTAPVATHWPSNNMLPSGSAVDVRDTSLPRGVRFGDAKFDDAYANRPSAELPYMARIDDPAANRRLTISYSAEFSHTVVFTPPHREAICIEPYSCLPNAYELERQGHQTGLRTLAPGARQRLGMTIELSKLL